MMTADARPLPPLLSGAKPLLGHLLEFRANRQELFQRGFREHGDVFAIKLGPQPVAVLIGPENHELFFMQTDDELNISTPYHFLEAAFGQVLFIAPHEVYLRQRPLVLQAFRRQKMMRYAEVMQEQTQRWLDTLGESGELELTGAINNLVQQIAGHALMGEEFQRQVGDEFWQLYLDIGLSLDPVLPPSLPLPKFIRRDRAKKRMKEILTPIIAERRRNPEKYDDFLQDFVCQSYDDGTPVEDAVLLSLMLGLMFAGHETTAGQAGWNIILLLQHPAYQQLVQQEIDELLPPGTALDDKVMRGLQHLSWAVRETERLRPSADMLYRDVDEPVVAGGYQIPAGWRVQIASEVAHLLPELWENAEQYDPLRYAPGREEHKQHRFSLIGFGGGTHKCMGMNFANNEMMIIAALFFQQYEVELLTKEPAIRRGMGANRPTETWIRYRARDRAVTYEEDRLLARV
jgi:sterol 14alpha-demethylase